MLINYTSVLLLLAAASQPLEIKTVGGRMHAGIGEGLPELRGVDGITGPIVGAFSPLLVNSGMWEVKTVRPAPLFLCPGHLAPGT